MFKHILLPVDGSALSLRAADMGIALAARVGARVHGLHVLDPFPAIGYFAQVIQASRSDYDQAAVGRAEQYLAEVSKRARAAAVPCDSSHEFDHRPYCAIIDAARKHHCDLIVMASHGWRGLDRLLLGSETQKVLLHGNLPVLVCH